VVLAGLCVLTTAVTLSGGLAGCARGGEYKPVGRNASGAQEIVVLAPGGELRPGKNSFRLRLVRTADKQPLDVPAGLEFVLGARGSAPVRVPVDLEKTGPGAYSGSATLDIPGVWWAEVTFNGSEGTQTVRVRVTVGR
jgi:hypothetical protein